MKKLLIFVDWFAPGFMGGGQIQSCINLVTSLQDDLDISLVTTDRDLGSDTPYDTVRANEWNDFDRKVRVMYLSPSRLGYKSIKAIIRSVSPDIIYLNSMFSYRLSLLPLEVCRFDGWKTKTILAPRGMLHKGALQYKSLKKKLFFHAFKVRGFHRKITFHATDHREENDVRKIFGKNVKLMFVPDFPASKQDPLTFIEKKPGLLRLFFVGRMTATKNLQLVLWVLGKAKGQIEFTVVGPPEDPAYWEECERQIESLPSGIKVNRLGALPNHQLPSLYRSHHLFILPSQGENFGHVIFESLVNGRPVLISDLTPWKELEKKHVGWDLSLKDEEGFGQAIKTALEWDQQAFDSYCKSAWNLASGLVDTSDLKKQYLTLFE